jgi:3-phenylpropionate/cinnamic acid dioxygenase small subunit
MIDTDRDQLVAQLQAQVRELLDRSEIANLTSRLGLLLDEKRFDDMLSVFTDDVIADFPHTGAGQIHGAGVLADYGRKSQGVYERAHHVLTNQLVELDGDRATVRANLIATHVPRADQPGSHFDVGEYYHFEMVRTPRGWRISRLSPHPVWTSGVRPARTS